MDQFIIRTDVPILDEHVLYVDDEEGNKHTVRLNARKLQYIADKANKRIKETGDLAPIVIGHTKDNAKEDDQPEIVGYATNFRVKQFLKTTRKAIVATFKFFKHAIDKVKKYPRRSVELWLDDWTIDPISLLGATTPERDLGLLKFEKQRGQKVRIIYGKNKGKPMANDQKQLIDAVMKAFEQTAVYKWACKKMEEEGQSEEGDESPEDQMDDMGGGGGGLPDEADAGMEPSEEEPLDQEGGDGHAVDEEDDGQEPMRYAAGAAGASMPSGSNTYTPLAKTGGKTRAKMQKNQERSKLARYERTSKVLFAKLKGLENKLRLAERERDLIQLEAEGIDFDRVEELDDVVDMPESAYQRHLQKMRTRYNKTPIWGSQDTGSPFRYSRTETVDDPAQRKALTDQAVALATKEGIDFGTALERIGG